MSLNKVLNRPMFRREALRRGVLKPIKAKVGQYIQQGPMMQQGPMPAQGPYSMIPTEYQGPKGKSFFYDPKSGSYLTGYGQSKMKAKAIGGLQGLAGPLALYSGLQAVSPTAAYALGGAELTGLGMGFMSKRPGMQLASRMLTGPSRYAASNPLAALGIGTMLAIGGGTKDYFQTRELVKEYAKAKGIPEKKALSIFDRDFAGKGGRPITDIRKSDIGKLVMSEVPGMSAYLTSGISDRTPSPAEDDKGMSDLDIAKEMRSYADFVKTGARDAEGKQILPKGMRIYQDVDTLVKKYKDLDKARTFNTEEIVMPEDQMLQDQQSIKNAQEAYKTADTLTLKIMNEQMVPYEKARNIAMGLINGDINTTQAKEVATNDVLYAKVPNLNNDQKHPEVIKEQKNVEQIKKKQNTIDQKGPDTVGTTSDQGKETGASGTGGNSTGQITGDAEIDEAKKIAGTIDMTQFLKADPRKTAQDPQQVFLMKLAAGLLSGKTMKGGMGGFAEVFGQALGPAVDAKILVKMKNDEAYRDWASTVLSYNTDLIKLRNDALKEALDAQGKSKFDLGSFEIGGQFYEAKINRDTSEVLVYNGKEYVPVAPDAGQFYKQQDSSAYMDNIRLIADGQLSEDILKEQIALMSTDAGRKAIGGSGVIIGFAEVLKNLPSEIKDGLVGSVSADFSMSQGDLSDKEFADLQKRADKVLGKFESKTQKFLSGNPNASEILGKLKVNARTLTYTLANALKDKDRLTNRDLDLIEELTGFLGVEPDDKIVQKYEELLGLVQEKNRLRRNKFYTLGYTNNDINGILNSFGTGKIIQGTSPQAFETDMSALDFLMGVNQ